MSKPGKSTVTLPNDLEVVVVRAFNAPRKRVFDAWTTPSLLQRWLLGPPGWTMPVCEMDLKPGGTFKWRWRKDATGAEFGFTGEFHEVLRPTRIVYTERYDPGDVGGQMADAHVTATFVENAGITTHTMTARYASKEARDAAVKTGMTDGAEKSYEKLDALLEGRRDRAAGER